jgi:hypothetical protein
MLSNMNGVICQVVGWLSLAVAGASFVVSFLAWRKSNENQERLLGIEEPEQGQADPTIQERETFVCAEIEKEGIAGRDGTAQYQYWLLIHNKGLAEARDVKVSLDGKPLPQYPAISGSVKEITQIAPGISVPYCLMVSPESQQARTLYVKITWCDETGQPAIWERILALPR